MMSAKVFTKIPAKPGVYIFKSQLQTLYVGKANNLRVRINQYQQGADKQSRLAEMLKQITEVETIIVTNEREALLLEATLIKKLRPRYNIRLVDDKSYPYVCLTFDEPIPRLSVVRKPTDRSNCFGPYLSARLAHQTSELLRRLYGIHLANKKLRPTSRPCFYCQIYDNPCVLSGEITIDEYRQKIEQAMSILQGTGKQLIKDLKKKMEQAANNQKYELAAKLRDDISSLDHLYTPQFITSSNQTNFDCFGLAVIADQGAVVLHQYRRGDFVSQSHYCFESVENSIDLGRIFFINYYLNMPNRAGYLIVPSNLKSVLKEVLPPASNKLKILSFQRGFKSAALKRAQTNAQYQLMRKLRGEQMPLQALEALTQLLGLPAIPEWIEMVDISNLGDSQAVGAITCYHFGLKSPSDFRRYKIKSINSQNDFAMLEEVVTRRFKNLDRPYPDLFVIDGGLGQLNSANKAIQKIISDHQARTKIIALAKKPDRIFTLGRQRPLNVPRNHLGQRLIAKIRDETHRFAISYHRRRQRRESLKRN